MIKLCKRSPLCAYVTETAEMGGAVVCYSGQMELQISQYGRQPGDWVYQKVHPKELQ